MDVQGGWLPVPVTVLIGRVDALRRACELLEGARLVTVVGPGGVGKTRLAVEAASAVAAAYETAGFVDGARLRRPEQLLPAVAASIGLRDAGSQPLGKTVRAYLCERAVLLVADNLEHLLPDAALTIAELLADGPRLRILATSRAPVQVPGEQLLPLAPLGVPGSRTASPLAVAGSPAVSLFVERVRAVVPDFELTGDNARDVAEICITLDGLPLALELAAPHVRTLGLAEVLTRSRHRYELLSLPRRAAPHRHRSLASAVRWSADLLAPPARRAFEELSMFTGGWTADAAAEVCGEQARPALAELVDQSLVEMRPSPAGPRYHMLETLREWAAGALAERGATDKVRERHLAWVLRFAQDLGAADSRGGDAGWLDRAEAEHANVLAALDGCGAEHCDAGLRIAAGMAWFWDVRGYLAFGRAQLERLLAIEAGSPEARALALDALGRLAMYQSDHETARRALRESIKLSASAGDRGAVAWSTSTLAFSAYFTGDVDSAAALAESVIDDARFTGDPTVTGRVVCALGLARWAQGRAAESRALFDENERTRVSTATAGIWARGRFLYFVGWTAHADGDDERACRLLTESLGLLTSIGDRRSSADPLDVLGCRAARLGDPAQALRLLTVARDMRAASGVTRHGYLDRAVSHAGSQSRQLLGTARAAQIVAAAEPLTVNDVLSRPPAQPAGPATALTARERQVAGLAAAGMTNRQIGRRLGISERTAERHMENLRAKLGARSRAQVAAWVAGTEVPTRPR